MRSARAARGVVVDVAAGQLLHPRPRQPISFAPALRAFALLGLCFWLGRAVTNVSRASVHPEGFLSEAKRSDSAVDTVAVAAGILQSTFVYPPRPSGSVVVGDLSTVAAKEFTSNSGASDIGSTALANDMEAPDDNANDLEAQNAADLDIAVVPEQRVKAAEPTASDISTASKDLQKKIDFRQMRMKHGWNFGILPIDPHGPTIPAFAPVTVPISPKRVVVTDTEKCRRYIYSFKPATRTLSLTFKTHRVKIFATCGISSTNTLASDDVCSPGLSAVIKIGDVAAPRKEPQRSMEFTLEEARATVALSGLDVPYDTITSVCPHFVRVARHLENCPPPPQQFWEEALRKRRAVGQCWWVADGVCENTNPNSPTTLRYLFLEEVKQDFRRNLVQLVRDSSPRVEQLVRTILFQLFFAMIIAERSILLRNHDFKTNHILYDDAVVRPEDVWCYHIGDAEYCFQPGGQDAEPVHLRLIDFHLVRHLWWDKWKGEPWQWRDLSIEVPETVFHTDLRVLKNVLTDLAEVVIDTGPLHQSLVSLRDVCEEKTQRLEQILAQHPLFAPFRATWPNPSRRYGFRSDRNLQDAVQQVVRANVDLYK